MVGWPLVTMLLQSRITSSSTQCGVAVEIEKFISTQICAHPLIKSFSLVSKVHSCLISRCDKGDGYGYVDNPFSKYGRRICHSVFLSDLSTYEGGQLEIQSSQESSTYRLLLGMFSSTQVLHFIVFCPWRAVAALRLLVGLKVTFKQKRIDCCFSILMLELEACWHGMVDLMSLILSSRLMPML